MKEIGETFERTNERPRKSKKCAARPKSRRPRMSEDEDINLMRQPVYENALAERSKELEERRENNLNDII